MEAHPSPIRTFDRETLSDQSSTLQERPDQLTDLVKELVELVHSQERRQCQKFSRHCLSVGQRERGQPEEFDLAETVHLEEIQL